MIDRIKQFLEYKGLSKNAFYVSVGLSNGFLDKPRDIGTSKIENIIRVYPEINPIWLLLGKGEMLIENINTETSWIISEPGFVYQHQTDAEPLYDENDIEVFTNKNGSKFFVYSDNTIKIEVPLLSEPAYAGYVESFAIGTDINLEELPTTTFKVDQIGKGKYLAFTTKNDSMWNNGGFDTPSGAEVLGREVGKHLWADGFRRTDYGFILLTKNAIYHKDILDYNNASGMLILGSRNPEVKDFQISVNDVYQVYNVIKRSF